MAVADAAVERSTNRCLEGTGFVYEAPGLGVQFRQGAIPLPWYFEVPDNTSTQALDAEVDDSLDPALEKALYGEVVGQWRQEPQDTTPAYLGAAVGGEIYDGCLPTAKTEIIGGGDPERSYQLIDFYYMLSGVEAEAINRVVSSAEYQEARADWRTCLDEHGYPPTRFEPDENVMTQPAPLTEEEVRTANDCSSESGMAAFGDGQLERELQGIWESQLGLIEDFRTRLDAVRQRALAD